MICHLGLDGRSESEGVDEQRHGGLLAEELEVLRLCPGLSERHLILHDDMYSERVVFYLGDLWIGHGRAFEGGSADIHYIHGYFLSGNTYLQVFDFSNPCWRRISEPR